MMILKGHANYENNLHNCRCYIVFSVLFSEYRLRCTQKNFMRLWYRCIRRYHLESTCFRRLRIL